MNSKDARLQRLWRKALMIIYKESCGLCGAMGVPFEAHHIVFRRRKFLRWDLNNGIILCKKCHQHAHTKLGEIDIHRQIGNKQYMYLCRNENIIFKNYLVQNGIIEAEFFKEKERIIREVIGGA